MFMMMIYMYVYPQGRRTIVRPKKRWREQLYLWRRNGSKGPILDVYDDDDILCYAVTVCLCMLCGSRNKDSSFPHATIIFSFLGAFAKLGSSGSQGMDFHEM